MKKLSLYLFLFSVLLQISCEQQNSKPSNTNPKAEKNSLILISAQGDTIPTGLPIVLEGKKINTDSLPKPQKILANPKQLNAANPQIISLEKNKVRYHSNNKDKVSPFKTTLAKPKKVTAIFPISTPAFPLVQKKEGFQALTPEQGLNSFFINDIITDHSGKVWIASNKGLSSYDGKSFRHYTPNEGLAHEEVFRVLNDKQGNIWISHHYGLGITKYDGKNFYQYGIAEGLTLNSIIGLQEDQNGDIWIKGTTITNVLKFVYVKFDEQTFSYYDTCEAISAEICNLVQLNSTILPSLKTELEIVYQDSTVVYTAKFFEKNPVIFQAPQLAQNSHWIIHNTGISRLEGQQLVFYSNEDFKQSKYDYISDIKENRFGQLWLPSKGGFGLMRFNPKSFQALSLKGVFESSIISALTEGQNGEIWLGSFGFGLAKYDGQTYTVFPEFNQKKPYIRALYQDKEGVLWIGTMYEGLYKYDGKTFVNFNTANGLPSNDIYAITEDKAGNLWLGTAFGGLSKFDGHIFTHYTHQNTSKKFDSSNTIRALLSDQKGNTWIGGYGGLQKFDGKYFTYYTQKEGLRSNRVVTLLEDSKGRIWVGTDDAGVHCFDGKSFKNYATIDGLTSNEIWTITEDAQGNIWLGADECLNMLIFEEDEPKKLKKVIEYCNMNGLRGAEFFANTGILDSQGRMWWGTNRTLLRVSSQYVQLLRNAPKIALEEIEIAQNRLDFRQLSDSIKAGKDWKLKDKKHLDLAQIRFEDIPPFYNYPTALRLPYHLNQINFRFTAFNYPYPERLKFSYFIDGIDKQWSEPIHENKIEYRNIPPGKYILQAKAVGEEQIWSEVFEYSFVVWPPWWQTWWAYALWFALISSVLYGFYRFTLLRKLEKTETKRVKEMDTLKNRLYTNITHEFRTPLTVIMGVNQQIQGHPSQTELIARNSQNLLGLVNQMLDLSKLESGKLKVDYIQGDVILYVRYLTASFHSLAHEKDIQLVFQSEDEKLLMDYDEAKLLQIINNLLSNALKFTPKGGKVLVEISKSRTEKKGYLQIKVKDSGIGISSEQLPHIFERFYQIDNSSTRKGEGTGIGLTFTKELVKLLEGEMSVKSKKGEGTEFIILLPIQHNASLVSSSSPSLLQTSALPSVQLVYEKEETQEETSSEDFPELLIIEDNPDVVLYIKSILQNEYRIHIAENGNLGIEKALEFIPDIIISDVMMPEKDGYEVCEILKQDERTSHIPIILLTAKSTREDKLEGLKYGADAFLTKPFDKEELLIRLRKLIDTRQKIQTHFQKSIISSNLTNKEQTPPKTESLEDRFLKRLNAILHQNISDETFGIEELCEAMQISRVQLHRKLKALTNLSTSIYIRQVRLLKAQELLQNTEMNISEVAYAVGFKDPAYFTRKFTEVFGKPPRESRIS